MQFLDARLPDRFWSKVIPEPNSGCWLWLAAGDGRGYGAFGVARRVVKAYKYSYELLIGAVPAGMDLDHLCRTRCCVNPAHLHVTTRRENVRRGAQGRELLFPQKTTCKYGHPLSGDNLRLRPDGTRKCRQCECDYAAASHRRRKGTP